MLHRHTDRQAVNGQAFLQAWAYLVWVVKVVLIGCAGAGECDEGGSRLDHAWEIIQGDGDLLGKAVVVHNLQGMWGMNDV